MSVSAEAVLTRSVIATNAGNLLFGQSVHRMLSVPGTEIVPNNYNTGREGIDEKLIRRINSEFDHFVIPLANAFRPSFQANLQRLTRVISGLDIPVTVVGVGSQHELSDATRQNDPIADDVKAFMKAVLDRSASVGVRGELTAEYLAGLGFDERHVDVIGCPSIFLRGRNPAVSVKPTSLDSDSRIAMSVSPYVKQMAAVVERHTNRYPNLIYIPQNDTDLLTMLWGENPATIPDKRRPIHIDHPLYTADRMRFPLDPRTWIDFLQDFEFSFGTRIHGTISSILAGTPAMLLAHDSRTQELADYHAIPYKRIYDVSATTDAADLLAECDYSRFNARLPETFDRFTAFLEKNDLAHIYQPGNESTEFDDKLAAADLPPMVHPVLAPGAPGRREVMSRLRWLRQGKAIDAKRTKFAFKYDLPHTPKSPPPSAIEKKISSLEKELKEARSQLAAQAKILDRQATALKRLDVSLFVRGRRWANRMGRKVTNRAARSR
ncbi:polysaccharide pyruvyl transferase family protein [Spelaeicoccus albus]|uniref:Polysaccharide pyruvyl transferase domain-containing protein n=1 Tax=Spelaeicoccus albus TaxID=1280376 RepID=A0A7Z0AA80_9MICO|nr:polysaccharide pyruvyl transferase family protein [Spelaeicoccus albus]NYI66423.1 hypothetical protein [Spelaeicoccus albus]